MGKKLILSLITFFTLSASADEMVIISGKMTKEQEEQLKITMTTLCSFVHADRFWGLDKMYLAYQHKALYDKFFKHIQKHSSKYEKMPRGYMNYMINQASNEKFANEERNLYLELFYGALKEVGLTEDKIKITRNETTNLMEDLEIKLSADTLARYGYYMGHVQYPYFEIERVIGAPIEPPNSELSNRMLGLPMRVTDGYLPLVSLRPYNFYLALDLIVKAADTYTRCLNK